MKEINMKYYDEKNACIIALLNDENDENISYEDIIKKLHIFINIENQEVSGIHSLFQNILVKSAVDDDFSNIQLSTKEIESYDFFSNREFKKLLEFLEVQVNLCNDTLSSMANTKSNEKNKEAND